MTSAEIEAGIAEVCGQLNAAHARLVDLIAEALRVECWAGVGIHSCEQWVAWHTGLSPSRAYQMVEIARRQTDLPVTRAVFAAGELSVDQVAVVARHTPPAFEAEVADFARAATVSQLRRTLRSYTFAETEPDPVERPDPTHVTGLFDDTGRYRLHALMDLDDGALVDSALREGRDALFRAGAVDVTWCDALVEMACRSLGGATPLARRDTFTAYFHVHTDRPGAYLHNGPALPDALRRQLLCDGRVAVVGLRGGRPVDVGRTRWIVPAHTRRIIENRDRGCRVPGCGRNHVEVHHIVHWLDDGPTNTWNLVALCPYHHRLHHRGLLHITGNADQPDGLTFTDRRGRALAGAPPPKPPDPTHPGAVTGHWQHPTGERLQSKWVHFNPTPTPTSRTG